MKLFVVKKEIPSIAASLEENKLKGNTPGIIA